MTDNDIVKALECCIIGKNGCKCCPLWDFSRCSDECENELTKETIDLINSQNAEIERLQHILISFMNEAEVLERKYGVDTSNIPAIAVLGTEKQNIIKQTEAEAIKDFAERLKRNHITKDDKGKLHLLIEYEEFDNLVKEYVLLE